MYFATRVYIQRQRQPQRHMGASWLRSQSEPVDLALQTDCIDNYIYTACSKTSNICSSVLVPMNMPGFENSFRAGSPSRWCWWSWCRSPMNWWSWSIHDYSYTASLEARCSAIWTILRHMPIIRYNKTCLTRHMRRNIMLYKLLRHMHHKTCLIRHMPAKTCLE